MTDRTQPPMPAFGEPPTEAPTSWTTPQYAYPGPGAPAYPPAAEGQVYQPGAVAYPPPGFQPGTPQASLTPAGPERVGTGLLFALGGALLGGALTVILWKFGIQWSFTSFVLAAASVYLYRAGSGGVLKQGVVPLIGLIVAGTVVSFFACVAVDAYGYWASEDIDGSPWAFVADNIFRPEVLGSYARDIAFCVVFATLGMFSTLRRVVRSRA